MLPRSATSCEVISCEPKVSNLNIELIAFCDSAVVYAACLIGLLLVTAASEIVS